MLSVFVVNIVRSKFLFGVNSSREMEHKEHWKATSKFRKES